MASTSLRWLIYGFAFGLSFPLTALSIDITLNNMPFSWLSIKQAHEHNFLHWIIDCAPFILSFTGYIIGMQKHRLEQHAKNLEAQVLERTTRLANALNEARSANQAKSEFLSRMSHELRTPLNAIIGFGQLIELDKEILIKEHQDNVHEIMVASHHLLNMITEVLDLIKIEANQMEIVMDDISIDTLLHESIQLISTQAKAHQLKLVNHISNKGYSVRADATRLKQILINLLSNAVKYNHEKGSITLWCNITNKNQLRICITDTGEGIPADKINQLFIPFERLNSSKNVDGTGIGLTISKHLIELMNGSIGVDSTPGKGSTFWVELTMSDNMAARKTDTYPDI
ncbi:MAG: hypothetical protein GQ532_09440 [Methylomarinum sp.]|nr:hypothetical protein [Methylomarinum sp.]